MMESFRGYRGARFICIVLAAIGLTFFVEYIGILKGMDNCIYDLFFRLRGARDYNQDIVIVAIDEKTLSRLGRWPIKRSYYGDMLKFMGDAKVVAFDIILAEPSEDDSYLAREMKRHGKVVLPVYIDDHFNISLPQSAFSSSGLGHVHLEQGVDGVVREIYHSISFGGVSLPSFSAAIYASCILDGRRRNGIEALQDEIPKTDRILQEDPVHINYYGPRGTFPYISLSDIIEGKWPKSFFKDKIVLVGVTTIGVEDSALTPFTEERNRMPGVEVHANILNNILDQTKVRIADRWVRWPAAFLLSFLLFFLFIRLSGTKSSQLWLFSLFSVTMLAFLLFSGFDLWLSPTSFYLSFSLVFIAGYIFKLERMGLLLLSAKADWEESFNTINEAITIHDKDCRIIRSNETAEKVYGDVLMGVLKERCLRFRKQWDGRSEDQEVLTGMPSQKETIEEIFEPRLEKHLEIKSLPRYNKGGRFKGVVQIVRDMTERVRLDQEREELRSHLTKAQKMEAIGTLAGGIAHDFNNILSAIMGYAELAANRMARESKARLQLEEVIKAGERAKDLVTQILTFSRQTEQEKQPIPVGLIAKEAMKLVMSVLPPSIEVRTTINSDGKVMGDPTQIHQIIMNLCTNAYHAMQKGGGVLSLAVAEEDVGPQADDMHLVHGTYLKITVSDTGEGIDNEHLKNIFDPYFTTKKRGEGTGLGLSIVEGIVKSYGGGIRVNSQPGVGSSFHIFLPKVHVEPREETQVTETIAGGNERILLIDDEEALVLMTQEMLEQLGYAVFPETNSLQALETFRNKPDRFDLVITNMSMPHMNGDELSKELMHIRPDIPIILCTGFSELITAEEAEALGIRAFVMKPILTKEMAKTIRGVLDEDRIKGYA